IFQGLRTAGVGEQMIYEQNFFIERILPGAVIRGLDEAEMTHYRAPFLEPASRKPMLSWPREIPIEGTPADMVAIVPAYRDALTRSPLPKLMFTVEPGIVMPAPVQ